ncbi:hypothetical protein ACFO1B_40570 [Dactylosporangium siamense]|uniref:Uncharacterized protein n=1 Tax=Dactylosporangium siamense TaxID=685454 RepID=A0A919PXG6_9ACTN|nr:hypothetical protein [Dactylosporangium siamense]GIG52575.1 hypothetical protein Dsi01nite_106160 [Dactylosporangium siamense]
MADDWTPPERGRCTCAVHLEQVLDVVVQAARPDLAPMTVAELLGSGDLKADPLSATARRSGAAGYHWSLWVGDTARGYYDDRASLQLDQGILAAPGVVTVEWIEREEFIVGAPTLCADGMTAVVAGVLADPRVRR